MDTTDTEHVYVLYKWVIDSMGGEWRMWGIFSSDENVRKWLADERKMCSKRNWTFDERKYNWVKHCLDPFTE